MTIKKLDPVLFSCMLGIYSSISLMEFLPKTDLVIDISATLEDVHDILMMVLEEKSIPKSKMQELLDKAEDIIEWTDLAIRRLNLSNE